MRLWPFGSISKPNGSPAVGAGGVEKLDELVQRAVEWKKRELAPTWDKCRKYYSPEGQKPDMEQRLDEEDLRDCITIENYIFPTIQSWVATICQTIPDPFVVSVDGEQSAPALAQTDYLQAWYEEKNIAEQQAMALLDCAMLGSGLLKTRWDPLADDVAVENVNPYTVFPDPAARRTDWRDACHVTIRNIYSKAQAEELWPEKSLAQAEQAVLTENQDPLDLRTTGVELDDLILVWECYHDFGRKLVIYSNKVVLYDGPNPAPNPKVPLFLFRVNGDSTMPWGRSVIPYLIDPQDEINRIRTRMSVNSKYAASPVLHTDDPQAHFDITPGGKVTTEKGTTAKWMEPPRMPAFMLEMLFTLKAHMESVSGNQEATQGIRPKGITTGVGLQALQAAAHVRTTGVTRWFANQHRAVAQSVLELMQQNYAQGRRDVAIYGGGEPRVASVTPEMLSEPQADLSIRPHPLRVVMDFRQDLPKSQTALAQILTEGAQLGFVDQQGWLDGNKVPGREAMVKRMADRMAGQQAGQQQGQDLAAQLQNLPPEMVEQMAAGGEGGFGMPAEGGFGMPGEGGFEEAL